MSFVETGGSFALVVTGSIVVGSPGAPGLTTDGTSTSGLCAWASDRPQTVRRHPATEMDIPTLNNALDVKTLSIIVRSP